LKPPIESTSHALVCTEKANADGNLLLHLLLVLQMDLLLLSLQYLCVLRLHKRKD
jgi:hypothetical protein